MRSVGDRRLALLYCLGRERRATERLADVLSGVATDSCVRIWVSVQFEKLRRASIHRLTICNCKGSVQRRLKVSNLLLSFATARLSLPSSVWYCMSGRCSDVPA